uniref:Uncharacterized protein n=1 Tax=Panagrolaimus sp. PS1159 TaxID=55785 RepID=A0AC35G1T0_9BILA
MPKLLPKAPREFICLLKRILVYKPKLRLCGRELLTDPFFDDIFITGKKRLNGRLISDAISMDDITGLRKKRSTDTNKSRDSRRPCQPPSMNVEETQQKSRSKASAEKLSKEKCSKEKLSKEKLNKV